MSDNPLIDNPYTEPIDMLPAYQGGGVQVGTAGIGLVVITVFREAAPVWRAAIAAAVETSPIEEPDMTTEEIVAAVEAQFESLGG